MEDDKKSHNIDCIALTEHFLPSGEDKFVNIEGYNLVSCYSRTNHERGGSCIFLKKDIRCSARNDLKCKSNELDLECTGIEIPSLSLIIINIYRSPRGNIENFFKILEDILTTCNIRKKIILCGDFNINLLDTRNKNVNHFLNILKSFNLNPTIKEPTRVTRETATLIDNIFTNIHSHTATIVNLTLSDHYAQQMTFSTRISYKNKTLYAEYRKITNAKLQNIYDALQQSNMKDKISKVNNVNIAMSIFYAEIIYLYNIHCPKKIHKVQSQANVPKPWLTEEIRRKTKQKRIMYENRLDKDQYQKCCRELNNLVNESKKNHNSNFVKNASNKTKAVWSVVKQTTEANNSNGKFCIKDLMESKKWNAEEALQYINKYFINICETFKFNQNRDREFTTTSCKSSLFFSPTDEKEVYEVINDLKNTNSVGPDDISVKLLKYCASVIAGPLSLIINLSLETGIFPDDLKDAFIIPILKNNKQNDIENLRPIALLSNVSKIIEKIIYKRIMNYLEKHNILSDAQNGYVKGRSTVRAVFQFIEDVIDALNSGNQIVGIFLDLSKAFDSIDHVHLLNRLDQYGFRGTSHMLLTSYLTSRKQCVQVKDEYGKIITSNWEYVKRGVPQGSILGPLLFLLYINNLPENISHKVVMFADDNTLSIKENNRQNLEQSIINVMNVVQSYYDQNYLKLNVEKTKMIKFSTTSEETIDIHLNNGEITSSFYTKFLGIVIDCKINFREHINQLAPKVSSFCYALKVLSQTTDESTCLTAYHAYVNSKIRYGIIFWGNTSEALRIFILQKRCLRSIYNLKQTDSCKSIFAEKNLLTLPSLYILESACFVKENYEFFVKHEMKHICNTRYKNMLKPIKTRLTSVQNSVVGQLIKVYNKLPHSLKILQKHVFKKKLKTLLLSKTYYSTNDYFSDNLILNI